MGKCVADALRLDPRLAEGKRLILEAVKEHQGRVQAIRGPHPSLKEGYERLLERAKELRAAGLWYPYIGSGIGNGPFVELADGSVKLDLISGIGVHPGHSLPEMVGSAIDAASNDLVMQGNLQQNREAIELMEQLTERCSLPHCFLTTSGAMAVENGLKLAFQKQAPKRRLLAFANSFHGRTCTLSQVTDRPAYREGLPSNLEVDYLPFYPGDALGALQKHLQAHPHDYAAFLFEPVQGEGGIYTAPSDFFRPLLTLLKAHDIAILADEIQTFGRTASLLACQALGLLDLVDIVTIGKLGQVCATLFRTPYKPRAGLLSQTFISSTSAIYAAKSVLGQLESGGRREALHTYFVKGLGRFEPQISGPYGVGLMCAFSHPDGEGFVRRLFDNGVLVFVAGAKHERVRMLLPPCIKEEHLDLALEKIGQTLEELG
ncbi:MAG: aminotransferase class III-fold pyridoxal phosphate-dependent enzyme [Parachlamydiales bacterium]